MNIMHKEIETAVPYLPEALSEGVRDVLRLDVGARHPRLRLLAFDDIKVGVEPNYLIKGLVPREGLVLVWGPPKSGKSFWVFDLAMHIALGGDYRGRRVNGGPVVYVAAEGASGLRARVEAFRQERLGDAYEGGVPFYLVPVNVDLVVEHGALIGAVRQTLGIATKPAAVVIDTLNRTLRGSESSDQDMAAFIAAADAICEAFQCAVIIVHHCGVDTTRPRGHTSLGGAVETQIAIKRVDASMVSATVEWMKDGPEGERLAFRLVPVEIGMDADGDAITSCVVEPVEHSAPPDTGPRLSRSQTTMFTILHNARSDGLSLEEWNEQARQAGVGAKRKADLYDLREALKRKELVYISSGRWFAKR